MAETTYVEREEIQFALDVKPSAYMGARIDRACLAGSRAVESFCHRVFYPLTATRTFDYPGDRSTALALWLDDQELISATAVVSDGVTIPSGTGYLLRPDIGPPFHRIEIERDSSYSFSGGPQRAISITGLWGYRNDETQESTLAAAIASTSTTLIDVNAPVGGVGAVIRIDSERMQVFGKRWVDSTITAPSLAAQANVQSVAVSNGSVFTENETILIDSERMLIVEISGNTLTVRRAVDGSSLAAHTVGAAIYWQHRLQVERGALGTTAATHLDDAPVYRWYPPAAIEALALAYAEDIFLQENSGYARTSGQGENERPTSGRGIAQLENRVRATYVRGVRTRAV